MFELRLLGGAVLLCDGHPIDGVANQRKPLALLAVLAGSGLAGASRDKLAALFWPEADTERARANLKQTLYVLRREAQVAELLLGTHTLRLNPAVTACDLWQFEQGLGAGDVEVAVEWYRGAFLDGFYVEGAPEFERWAERERIRLAGRHCGALKVLAGKAETAGQWERAAHWWGALAESDLLDDRAVEQAARALLRVPDLLAARRLLGRHAAAVETELGTTLSPALADLLRSLAAPSAPIPALAPPHASSDALRSSETAPVPAATPAPSASPPPREEALSRPASSPPLTRRWSGAAVAGSLGLVLAVTGLLVGTARRTPPPAALDSTRVAVAPFGVPDPELGLWREGLVDYLARNFDGAGAVRVVDPGLAIRRWRGSPGLEDAQDLGEATGARWVVVGQLLALGPDSVRLRAQLLDAKSQRLVGEYEGSGDRDRIPDLADSLTTTLLQRGWPALPSELRAEGVGTRSLPALKAFLRGEQFFRTGLWDSAEVAYRAATAMDSLFGMAWSRWAEAFSQGCLCEDSLHEEGKVRAAKLYRRAAVRDQYYLAADSARLDAGRAAGENAPEHELRRRLSAGLVAAERVADRYPDDALAWHFLGEARYHMGEDREHSDSSILAASDQAIRLDSSFATAYLHPVQLALNLGELTRASGYIDGYLKMSRNTDSTRVWLVQQLLRDSLGVWTVLDSAIGSADLPARMWAMRALSKWPDLAESAVRVARSLAPRTRFGRFHHSDSRIDKMPGALVLAYRGHVKEIWAIARAESPALVVELGVLGAVAPSAIDSALATLLPPTHPMHALAWAWWAMNGDSTAAQVLLKRSLGNDPWWGKRHPAELARDIMWSTAALALARRDSSAALRALTQPSDWACREGYCYLERLVKAQLLASQGRLDEAAAELEKGPTEIEAFPRPAMVLGMLERGRLAERLADTATALRSYAYVERAWHAADPPLQRYVHQARAARERLSPGHSRR